nr:competence type IV pilus minor pilin ComGF [Tetragenococcus halophilus]
MELLQFSIKKVLWHRQKFLQINKIGRLYVKNKGFTLIECAIALMVLGLFLTGILGVFQQSKQVQQMVYGRNLQEWHVFLIQFESKLAEGRFSRLAKDKIYYDKINSTTKRAYECRIELNANRNEIAIREKNGYEPILTEVKQLQFRKNNRYILFTVTFLNGEKKNGKWTIEKI